MIRRDETREGGAHPESAPGSRLQGDQPAGLRTDRNRKPRRRPRIGRAITEVIAIILIAGGITVLGVGVVAPEQPERIYGEAKTAVVAIVDEVRATAFAELPIARQGVRGGIPELDRCDGTFTEMASYERDGVPPVWAAHNNCGGDVTLPWTIGEHVRIEGEGEVYVVVDIRDISKTWSSTDDLVGIGGELVLQTCYYGENLMKFTGLERVS